MARCRKVWPSYLPSPGSSSLLWIIDYRWEQEFALQKGTYDAPWGQCSPRSKILKRSMLKMPPDGLFKKKKKIAASSLGAALWRALAVHITISCFCIRSGPAAEGIQTSNFCLVYCTFSDNGDPPSTHTLILNVSIFVPNIYPFLYDVWAHTGKRIKHYKRKNQNMLRKNCLKEKPSLNTTAGV